MKEIILKNYKITIIVIIIFLTIWYFINSNLEKEKQIDWLKQEVSQKSNEEKLVGIIKEKKENIFSIEAEIKEKEYSLDLYKKEEICYKQQLSRLVDWLEYSLDYCKNNDNLDKFQGLAE